MNKKVMIALASGLVIFLILTFAITKSQNIIQKRQSAAWAQTLYNTAMSLQSERKFLEAARLFQELVKQFPNFKQISDVEKKLWDLNIQILFSPVISENDIVYKVEPGDILAKIAAKYNTPVDLIKRSNQLQNDLIRPGMRLKISTAKYSVIIDKSQNALTLKADDIIFKVYSVATGKYSSTPSGTFQIVEKLKNPAWYKKGIGVIAADSPENILGTRWLGLSEPQYGIHGGAKTEDLGKQVTDGCVRMLNSDAEELFTVLPRGTEVIIVD